MIILVIAVLFILMLGLGIELVPSSLGMVFRRPKGLFLGLLAQQIGIPLIAFLIIYFLGIDSIAAIGIMLVACSAGGASSNVLTSIIRGNVVLSIWLTTISTIISIFSLPYIVNLSSRFLYGSELKFSLPVSKTILQMGVITLLPLFMGVILNRYSRPFAEKILRPIKKYSLSALILIVVLFFVQHSQTIVSNFVSLSGVVSLVIISSMGFAVSISRIFSVDESERKTLTIEVGIQNAAQAITIAMSPFLLNDARLAVPAILYALLMNVFVIIYISINKFKNWGGVRA